MSSCENIQDMLAAYIDGYLSDEEKELVENHIKECAECRNELRELEETVNLFKDLKDEELAPPPNFSKEIRRKLETSEDKIPKVAKKFNKLSWKTWMPIAMAAVLMVVVFSPIQDKFKIDAPNDMPKEQEFSAAEEAPRANFLAENKSTRTAPLAVPNGAANLMSEGTTPDVAEVKLEQKVIKTGYIKIEVSEYQGTSKDVLDVVKSLDGYVSNENTYIYDEENNLTAGNITIKIPKDKFEEAFTNLETLGYVKNKNKNTQDVTEEYIDTESHLQVMRNKENRLNELLNKTGSLGDVLAVETELAKTRGEIESLVKRQKYLDNSISFSTINVEVKESLLPHKQIKTKGFNGILGKTYDSFINSINSIILFGANSIVFLGTALPYILIAGSLIIIVWLIIRKIK